MKFPPRCARCAFYNATTPRDGRGYSSGECRALPPTVDPDAGHRWPRLHASHWCGSFKEARAAA